MSGLQIRNEEQVNGLDVREQGSALRVATNSPHLVSLGTGRLSTAVTIHHLKQGCVTVGSDPSNDIVLQGVGVAGLHCRVENSHGVVTLYPARGDTLVDNAHVTTPATLAQGAMIKIGQSNYLRFNNPEEAKLMKSMLPNETAGNTQYAEAGYNNLDPRYHSQYKENQLKLDQTLKEFGRKKPPVPRKPFQNDSDNEETKPKISSIMAKVSKFEYYAKQQKNVSRSQFYTNDNEISPKVFSANSPTVNTPAREVLGNKMVPKNLQNNMDHQKVVYIQENNLDTKGSSYANVAIRNRSKIDDIVRNFDENRLPKKIDNTQINNHVYGKINNDSRAKQFDVEVKNDIYGRIERIDGKFDRTDGKFDRSVNVRPCLPSPAFDRNPQYSPVYVNSSQHDRSFESESRRIQAYHERVKEEELKEAEAARLEEILNMCAEYEKQVASGSPITPTEKRSHNKIITNGSLPRSVAMNNPNFVQTSEGYFKFDTSHSRNNSMSRSLPPQRNVSSYENYDISQITSQSNSLSPTLKPPEGRMDEIGIPVFDERKHELSSPILIRKVIEQKSYTLQSPVGSPYENVYKNGLKPKSPQTQSPRSRIKTTLAHKNLPSPQYFIFPTPPPVDNNQKPNFLPNSPNNFDRTKDFDNTNAPTSPKEFNSIDNNTERSNQTKPKVNNLSGIEKQLSIEEDIPMIDDADVSDDIEYRFTNNKEKYEQNQSFDDVRKELMADIPELDEFEKDLKQNRERTIQTITDIKVDSEQSVDNTVYEDGLKDLKEKYENLKENRKKLMMQIHEYKTKMAEIRSQEDDILRELEMEKALIKGEYDSEIAILNIEQKKKMALLENVKKVEEDIKNLKKNQEARQNEMRERVDIATMKVERIEKDLKSNGSTLEELQNAQDILDNETKIYEDLEFQHLEEESELLANREDLQNELSVLTKKIESQKSRILTLKSEANNNLTSALDETKILQAEYVNLLNKVEEITTKVQSIEKELKPIVLKLNDIERTQSPDSAFYTDQTRAKSGEFGYSPQSSDSDDFDKGTSYEDHTKVIRDKFNSIDQMSQSMIVDIERRIANDDDVTSDSPSKSSTSSKEKKGFWERNFDSLKRKKDKKPKEADIMSQSLNENMFYNSEVENESPLDRFNSLRNSKNKKKDSPNKNTTSKIPTLAALGKIIKKDSFGKKSKEKTEIDDIKNNVKNRYVKNNKPNTENKYSKSKTPERVLEDNELPKTDTSKVLYRKSCGDEPSNRTPKISDTGKIPSQDDIDRISKVTLDAPILSNSDMNSLGKRTVDSLMEIERNRMAMLEEQGCQVIENEREKISELKRRVQSETKKLWDQKYKSEHSKSLDSDTMEFDSLKNDTRTSALNGRTNEMNESEDTFNMTGSTVFEDSSGLMNSSIEELQVRNSRSECATEDERRSDHSRPLSDASDKSRETLSLSSAARRCRRGVTPAGDSQRPLTRYLPVDRDDFDLRRHVESAGHQIDVCPHVSLTQSSCRGFLHKLGAKFHTWSKRWFVFDRDTKTFVYYWDKNERKPRGGAYFQVIEEVYLDHGNTSKSPNPQTTFIVKTRQRRYFLMAPSGEAARIWIDVIFTGAQGYTEYLE